MANNLERKIYIHQNLNKQELRQAVIENNSYLTKPKPNIGGDIGLLYYDTILGKILIWNGSEWKLTQFLDERDLTYGGDTFLEDIWTQTNLIPTSSPGASPVLEYVTGVTMSHIPNTYSFESGGFIIDNVVPPHKYGNIYEPVLKDINGVTISNALVNWKLERGIVTLYSGFTSSNIIVDESNPPLLSYWRYKGNKGNLGSNDTLIIRIDNTNLSWISPYNIVPFTYSVSSMDIISITVNSLLVYDYIYNSFTQTITLDESQLSYNIESTDVIHIEIKN